MELASEGTEIIEVEDLTVGYGKDVVLKDVSFSVREREILTILGPSGCGKTTLLKAMTGLLSPREGSIRVAGEEVSAEGGGAHARWQHMGVLFQSGALLGGLSVGENVSLPIEAFTDLPEPIVDAMVQLKLDLVRLGGDRHRMPAELSGGMRKRAALARAIALDPKVLFCDEPTSGLDPHTAVEIDQLLLELNEALGVTLVVVTHEVASIENIANRCIVLDGAEKGIIASGPPDTLGARAGDPRVRSFFRRRLPRRPPQEDEG